MALIDTHAHLTAPDFDTDREAVLARAVEAGVEAIITVGFDLATSRQAVGLAARHPGLAAAVGIHPNSAHMLGPEEKAALADLACRPEVRAIGETGLDYYRDRAPKDAQVESFQWHLVLARDLGLPVIVHDREAHSDTLDILRQHTGDRQVAGVMHCFSGNEQIMEDVLALGMHISLGGPVTYANAKRPLEIARRVPLGRLLLETDCPWLTPAPYRGRRNEPAFVSLIAEKIAAVRGQTTAEVAMATSANARACFGLRLRRGLGILGQKEADASAE